MITIGSIYETKYHNFLSTLYVFTDSKLDCIIVCQERSRKVEYFVRYHKGVIRKVVVKKKEEKTEHTFDEVP